MPTAIAQRERAFGAGDCHIPPLPPVLVVTSREPQAEMIEQAVTSC
jgi:hypothetical protein